MILAVLLLTGLAAIGGIGFLAALAAVAVRFAAVGVIVAAVRAGRKR